MEFMRLGAVGSEVPVLRCEGGSFDLRPLTDDLTPEFIARGGLTAAREALRSGRLAPLPDAETLRVGSPIARPHAVMCIGLNYAAHAAESNAPAPSSPILFFKHPNTLAGPDDAVPLPAGAERVDWEVELAIVIGSRASYTASSAAAAKHIAGFCLADDLSEREFQLNRSAGQWSKGKSCPGFLPLGPTLVPADVLDPTALAISSWVNGEPRQRSNTTDMIFSPAAIVHDLSQYLALDAGDIILTGTPEGVALSGRFLYLRDGDVVEVAIEGLGRQRHVMAARIA